MANSTILIISGTNRPDSNALKVAHIIEGHYRKVSVTTDLLSLTDLPIEVFQGTCYANKPPGMVAIQNRVLGAAGLHVVTPEYNGSFPGVLKYFIDMLKFPESFERKPVAFTGEAAGIWGAIRSVEQLQQIFGYRNAHIYPERVFIPGIVGQLDAAGKLKDSALDERLENQCKNFALFADVIFKSCKIA
ncbi:MAG TPA: NAD(P)H-dependent oxidoreductase [Tepidisphaeraceae bacterium]|jgi:NAD(P)H-dependent FMN reductase|nr:NAD(P)H-dependent oxidoreductase [Tepidisphaeraceae bacterium]